MTHVLETLQESPGVHRIEANCCCMNRNARPVLFCTRDFSAIRDCSWNWRCPGAWRRQKRSAAKACSFELRRWQESDYQHAAALITACYRGHIDSQMTSAPYERRRR